MNANKSTLMKLTPIQKDILLHRLDSGCIAEVLVESDYMTDLYSAEAAVDSVTVKVKSGVLDLESMPQTECWVLEDCLDGSTYFADEDYAIERNQTTKSKSRTAHKAADALEDAFSQAWNRQIVCARF